MEDTIRDDSYIVRRVLEGHRDDFALLVQHHHAMVHALALGHTGRWSDAEEVVQQAFCNAYQSLNTLRDPQRFAPWLARITRNLCHTITRKQRHEYLVGSIDEGALTTLPEAWKDHEMATLLHRCLADLSELDRQIVSLYYFAGLPSHRVAAIVERSSEAVRKRLQRIRETLGDTMLKQAEAREWQATRETPRVSQIMSAVAVLTPAWTPGPHVTQASQTALGRAAHGVKTLCSVKGLAVVAVCAGAGLAAYFLSHASARLDSEAANANTETVAQGAAAPEEVMENPAEIPEEDGETSAATALLEALQKNSTSADGQAVWGKSEDPGMIVPAVEKEELPAAVLGKIGGRVVDQDGKGIGEAQVSASGLRGGGQTKTDPKGAFTLEIGEAQPAPDEEVEEALFTVNAAHPAYQATTQLRVPLNETSLELTLTQEGAIAGFAVDSVSGRPVKAFKARISRLVDAVEGAMGSGAAYTPFESEKGAFVLPTEGRTTEIELRAEGYTLKTVPLDVPQGERLEGLVVPLDPGGNVSGIVLDAATREPLADVRVGIPAGEIRQWWGIRDEYYDTVTDVDGRFLITGKATGDAVTIAAFHEQYATEYVHGVRPGSSNVRILLTKGASVRGRVTRDGKPIAGLRMHLANGFGWTQLPNITPAEQVAHYTLAGTNPDGTYEFGQLPHGRYLMRIINDDPSVPLRDRYLGRMWVEVAADQTVDLDVNVADFGVVAGLVQGAADLTGVTVSLADARYPTELMYMTGEKHDDSGPDSEGNFQFCPVPAGTYIVCVEGGAFADAPVEQQVIVGARQTTTVGIGPEPAQ